MIKTAGGGSAPSGGGAPVPPIPGSGITSTSYLAGQAAAMPTVDPNSVFIGSSHYTNHNEFHGGMPIEEHPTQHVTVRHTKTLNDLMIDFERMSTKKKLALARKLALAGYLGQPYKHESLDAFLARQTLIDVESAYGTLLGEAQSRQKAGQPNLTPDAILSEKIAYNSAASGGSGWFASGGGSGGSGSKSPYANKTITTTSTSRDISSPTDARSLARQALQQELHRDPTEAEFEDFISALQYAQRTHPQTTATTTHYDANGSPVSTSSTTTGGLNASEFAIEKAQANPSWAEWQAVGTYFPAALGALNATVPGV